MAKVGRDSVHRFATDDPEVAHQFLIDSFVDSRMRFAGASKDFLMTDGRRDAGPFQIDEFEMRALSSFSYVAGDKIMVSRVRYGMQRVLRRGGPEVILRAGDLGLNGVPGVTTGSVVDEIRKQVLTLRLATIAEVAATDAEAEAGPVTFTDLRPSSTARARFWERTVDTISKLLDDADTRGARLIVGRADRLLAAVTLATFPHDAPARPLGGGGCDSHPDTLRRAIAFIEAEPDRDLTIADIARAAFVTPRAVQHAFRRQLETTPMAYLRQVRLDHSHRQLLAAVPGDGTTVARIALDWGFANPSRFARYYRDTYGRSPSATLAE